MLMLLLLVVVHVAVVNVVIAVVVVLCSCLAEAQIVSFSEKDNNFQVEIILVTNFLSLGKRWITHSPRISIFVLGITSISLSRFCQFCDRLAFRLGYMQADFAVLQHSKKSPRPLNV